MRNQKSSIGWVVGLATFAVSLLGTGTPASAQQEKVLHSFYSSGYDGFFPAAGLITDSTGNLYGSTPVGGIYGGGIVFKVAPKTGGGWTTKTLHAFSGTGTDGSDPTASLIFDAKGNLYGTTYSGGAYGAGTVFELSPTVGGGWAETVLYAFHDGSDGRHPPAALIFDADGNLYGTTRQGGTYNLGTVFELSPAVGGGWTETVLYGFRKGSDGRYPQAALIFDASGNLYGTTTQGGTYNNGTVFELKSGAGGWTEKILYNFNPNGSDGVIPFAGLVMDRAGNLYGTTNYGGAYGYGTVFEFSPTAKAEKILHSFSGAPADGMYPFAGLIFDASGNLYGTTTDGGAYGCGVVFAMTPTGSGWTEELAHSFCNGNGPDGAYPDAGMIFDGLGNLYGTTSGGGTYNNGTVFAIRP